MQVLGFHPKTVTSLMRNASEDGGHVLLVEPIEGPAQAVVIKHISADPCSQEMSDRFVLKELRDQVELPVGWKSPTH
ncbi:hypothetical protein Krac_6559 [Ktedonobacter racemifer DSM 44963]|uniref:Uncharacterized protein n=1 Tax=Ktedonobacter racemifer DSM 44963 TaxID=485913 RepID=D6TVF1_KTERA|nr:hypothetical protein Krac_6559 [Ktedonobacter racemifer DSM 44963]